MDAKEYNRKLDQELADRGIVDKSLFLDFCDAHGYGAASSIDWLVTKLRILKNRIAAGEPVSVYEMDGNSQVEVNDIVAYLSWTKKYFPSAAL